MRARSGCLALLAVVGACAFEPRGAAPVDECALGVDTCAPTATCTDTADGYACTCPGDRVGDGFTCQVPFVALTTGGDFTCGVAVGGAAWCWGGNDYAQLGDGTVRHRAHPVEVAGQHK